MANAAPKGRYDILVSGASFAGLAMARALAQAFEGEAKIGLIDRRPVDTVQRHDARAFALSAGSRRMLETLGAWVAVAADAQPVTTIEITDSELDAGVRPVLLTYDNKIEGEEAGSYIVPAAALERALIEIVRDEPSISILAPAEIQAFAAQPSHVDVQLIDGGAATASLLIAADGRRSPLRGMAGIKSVSRSYPQTGIVTVVAHDKPHGGVAVQHFLPAGPFAILPLPGNRACITWTEESAEAARILGLDDDGFLREVDRRFGGKLGAIRLDGPRQSWPLELHLARSYVAERFAVIGDAAHVVHPIAGQGLNLALRDVAALTESIVDAARLGLDPGAGQALERYEKWRRFDAAMSTAAFDGLNVLFSNDNVLVRAARDAGLGLVDRSPLLKQLFVAEAAGVTGNVPRLLRGEMV